MKKTLLRILVPAFLLAAVALTIQAVSGRIDSRRPRSGWSSP